MSNNMITTDNTINMPELETLSPQERSVVLQILKEMSTTGVSDKLTSVKYADYEEVPVDIITFMDDPHYLGKGLINPDTGKSTVFPYWREVAKKIYPSNTEPAKFNTLALSGSIGLGKSFIAVVLGLYDLYRTLCLKDPYAYYGLQQIDLITYAFINITIDAARGVAWDKCQQLLQSSPWFMQHGTVKGTTNIEWVPPKGIELVAGSQSRHIIGRAVKWCLDGDTQILTKDGYRSLQECVSKQIQVVNIDDFGNACYSQTCTVLPTETRTTEYQIELEDGSVLKCTPEHRFMLKDGTYKEACQLTTEDELLDVQPYGYVYKTTNKRNGKVYIGQHTSAQFDPEYLGSGTVLQRAIRKYGKKQFTIEVLTWCVTKADLDRLEKEYIEFYSSTNKHVGYNIGGQSGNLGPLVNKKISTASSKIKAICVVELESPKQYYDVINANPYNNFLVKTNNSLICSHNCFIDEVSFQPNQDLAKQVEKAKTLVNTAAARMQSRFMKGEYNPTLLILASSKRTEASFMEQYIAGKKKMESKTTYIVDEPQWVVRTDKDSPNKFYVAVGNKYLNSEVVPLDTSEEELDIYRKRGYTLLKIPMGYHEQFLEDIDVALTDIAGISTSSTNRYFSGPRVSTVVKPELQNMFTKEIIQVGDGPDDKTQYSEFVDLDRVDPVLKSRPMYVHLDMSISGDKTGIAGVWVVGKKPQKENQPDEKTLFYRPAFVVAIKAPKGHQVSFQKNLNFIYWLREQGFNIKGVTSDTFQNAYVGQALTAQGFNYSVLSVDRLENLVCKPYQYLRTVIYDENIELFKHTLLIDELIGLERDNNSGKIDHSTSGINCFTGDTLIPVCGQHSLPIAEIVSGIKSGKSYSTYSYNTATGRIEPRRIVNGWCSRFATDLIEVNLSTGETVTCTPQHRFMLRDGTYKQAQLLEKNDLLMPAAFKLKHKSDTFIYQPCTKNWEKVDSKFCINKCDELSSFYNIEYVNLDIHSKMSTTYKFNNKRANVLTECYVTSVSKCSKQEHVYDIEIEDTHNFALTAGIIVHNSKDCSDALCGAVYRASQDAEQFAFEYGDDFDTMIKVSTASATTEMQTMNEAFQDELKKMFDVSSKQQTEQKTVTKKESDSQFTDFGFGKAKNISNTQYLSQGIIVF